MTYEQMTLEVDAEPVHDWVEYTGCVSCGALIVVKWPERLFGQTVTCPKCTVQFIVCSAVLADREDFEKEAQ